MSSHMLNYNAKAQEIGSLSTYNDVHEIRSPRDGTKLCAIGSAIRARVIIRVAAGFFSFSAVIDSVS